MVVPAVVEEAAKDEPAAGLGRGIPDPVAGLGPLTAAPSTQPVDDDVEILARQQREFMASVLRR